LALFLSQTTLAASENQAALVERGRYLATAGDCISCHTRADGVPFAGGLAFLTAFGTIHSTNITPDPETGIGRGRRCPFRLPEIPPRGEVCAAGERHEVSVRPALAG
jgi:hypothetical protein